MANEMITKEEAMQREIDLEREWKAEKQIFDLSNRGMQPVLIAKVTKIPLEDVFRHLENIKKRKYENVYAEGRVGILGGVLQVKYDLEAEALRSLSSSPDGTPQKLHWIKMVKDLTDSRIDFMEKYGFIQRNTFDPKKKQKEVSKMQTTEIGEKIRLLRNRLLSSQKGELSMLEENQKLKQMVDELQEQVNKKQKRGRKPGTKNKTTKGKKTKTKKKEPVSTVS